MNSRRWDGLKTFCVDKYGLKRIRLDTSSDIERSVGVISYVELIF